MERSPRGESSLVGRTLGSYRVLELLGQGGMGSVYRAQDTRLGREVALKTVRPELVHDEVALARLRREARAVAALAHPAVGMLLDYQERPEALFLVFELLRGRTLREHVAAHPPSLAQALDLALPVAQALAAAHAAGLVHRDVKPDNVMVCADGAVKVLDFGLARFRPDAAPCAGLTLPGAGALTAEGRVVGTLHYMSPEQLRGQEVDARSDLFSFGVLLYELLAGRLPFAAGSDADEAANILAAEPLPPGRFNPAVPPELDALVLDCLRKEPGERPSSAAGLVSELARLRRRVVSGGAASAEAPAAQEERDRPEEADYFLPRNPARFLFVVVQLVYLAMYLAAFRLQEDVRAGLELLLERPLGATAAELAHGGLLLTALIGIAVRLYLIPLVVTDHARTGVRHRRAFPFFFLLDEIWAAAPLALLGRYELTQLLPFVPPLVYLPFSQRTLVRSAYDLNRGRRTSAGSRAGR